MIEALPEGGFFLSLATSLGLPDELTLPGLFWLSGAAPAEIRRPLLGAFVAEVVIAFATASARPFTGLAFGILVPVYGLGLAGLWGARAGTFPPRV